MSAGVLTKLNHWQVMKKISTFDFFDAPLTPYANTTPLPMHCAPKGFPVEIPVAKVESEAPVVDVGVERRKGLLWYWAPGAQKRLLTLGDEKG